MGTHRHTFNNVIEGVVVIQGVEEVVVELGVLAELLDLLVTELLDELVDDQVLGVELELGQVVEVEQDLLDDLELDDLCQAV